MKRLLLVWFTIPFLSHGQEIYKLDQFLEMSVVELYKTFLSGTATKIPDGPSKGIALLNTDRRLIEKIGKKVGARLWHGKIVDAENGTLINEVIFGRKMGKAKVYIGNSIEDDKPVVVIDYHTPPGKLPIRDEIREVGENLFLGRAYLLRKDGSFKYVIGFGLDFN